MTLVKTLLGSLALGYALVSSTALAETATTQPVVSTQADAQTAEKATSAVGDKLNINTASAAEIQKAFTGIGAKKAEAIVQYREKHGNFTSAEQLLEVQGIGKATLDKNRDRFVL